MKVFIVMEKNNTNNVLKEQRIHTNIHKLIYIKRENGKWVMSYISVHVHTPRWINKDHFVPLEETECCMALDNALEPYKVKNLGTATNKHLMILASIFNSTMSPEQRHFISIKIYSNIEIAHTNGY